jgi:acetyl esterase/lipase
MVTTPPADRRRLVPAAVLVAAALVLAGSASPVSSARPASQAPRLVAGPLTYASGRVLDVYAVPPLRPGAADRPVVVLVHGCCGDRADLGKLSEALASAGAVALNAGWAGLNPPATFPAAYADVACAVRWARARAARYGGDPHRVALLGWEDGALVVSVVGLAGDSFDARTCIESAGPARPDAVVGVAGFYGWTASSAPRYASLRAQRFLGGSPVSAPAAWRDATPYSRLTASATVTFRLIVGAQDPARTDAASFGAALADAGHPVHVITVPPGGDDSMISPRTSEGRATIATTLESLAP